MKRIFGTLVLLLGLPSVLAAQETGRWSLHAQVGVFGPTLPVISIDNGRDASLELESGAALSTGLSYRLGSWITFYGSLSHMRSRINHSSALETAGPARSSSPVNLFLPSAGFILARGAEGRLHPFVRLGAGVKFYEFNLLEVDDGVQDVAGDLGVGVSSRQGSNTITAEVRWLPSSFDSDFLPVRTVQGRKQMQNDWLFLLGFRFAL